MTSKGICWTMLFWSVEVTKPHHYWMQDLPCKTAYLSSNAKKTPSEKFRFRTVASEPLGATIVMITIGITDRSAGTLAGADAEPRADRRAPWPTRSAVDDAHYLPSLDSDMFSCLSAGDRSPLISPLLVRAHPDGVCSLSRQLSAARDRRRNARCKA